MPSITRGSFYGGAGLKLAGAGGAVHAIVSSGVVLPLISREAL
jgi:hypothetical protein